MTNEKMRFKLRRGDVEVELEGESMYVKDKFEFLLEQMTATTSMTDKMSGPLPETIEGIIEKTDEGRYYLVVPANLLTSKEALGLFLYATRPKKLSDKELAEIISSGWKTMKAEAVRARASELRRDGKLISEDGHYTLSGAGVQWVETSILAKIKNLP
jgi:hypothetical protein